MLPYQISEEHVWVGAIPDHPGALAERLRALAAGGLNLELIIGRRDLPGRALLFVSPLRTLAEIRVAEQAGMRRDENLRAVRIQGPNAPGLGARIATALADAGIDIRAFVAAALGNLQVTNVAFDRPEDAAHAIAILKRTLSS